MQIGLSPIYPLWLEESFEIERGTSQDSSSLALTDCQECLPIGG